AYAVVAGVILCDRAGDAVAGPGGAITADSDRLVEGGDLAGLVRGARGLNDELAVGEVEHARIVGAAAAAGVCDWWDRRDLGGTCIAGPGTDVVCSVDRPEAGDGHTVGSKGGAGGHGCGTGAGETGDGLAPQGDVKAAVIDDGDVFGGIDGI